MTTNRRSTTRRTVLKAVGGSAVGLGAVAGTASACYDGCPCVSDRVQAGYSTDVYDGGCPPPDYVGTVPGGTEGTVVTTCGGDGIDETWLIVDWDEPAPSGYVACSDVYELSSGW
jgi:hypothetical protein